MATDIELIRKGYSAADIARIRDDERNEKIGDAAIIGSGGLIGYMAIGGPVGVIAGLVGGTIAKYGVRYWQNHK